MPEEPIDDRAANSDITGRDDYIVAQALWVALRYLETLPEHEQPESNMDDMREILETRFQNFENLFVGLEYLKRLGPEPPEQIS